MVRNFCGKAQFSQSFSFYRNSFCRVIHSKFCGNCAFPQTFHPWKLGEITLFYTVQRNNYPYHFSISNIDIKLQGLELTFGHQPYKMVKHTQTIFRQQQTHALSTFDHFLRLLLRGLNNLREISNKQVNQLPVYMFFLKHLHYFYHNFYCYSSHIEFCKKSLVLSGNRCYVSKIKYAPPEVAFKKQNVCPSSIHSLKVNNENTG